MTPAFEKEEKVTLHCTCPECGKQWDIELSLTPDLADYFREKAQNILCDPCGEAREAEEINRFKEQAEQERIEVAGVPLNFSRWDESKGNKAIVDWVAANKHGNILLIGEVDTGKTRSMVKVLLDESAAGKKVLFRDFNSFADGYAEAMQEGISKARSYLQSIVNGGYDIILIDDLDKHRINETAGSLLYKIFNQLYSGDIASCMWFTMNHNGKEFLRQFDNQDYGAAVVSRIGRMMKDGLFHVQKIAEITAETQNKAF